MSLSHLPRYCDNRKDQRHDATHASAPPLFGPQSVSARPWPKCIVVRCSPKGSKCANQKRSDAENDECLRRKSSVGILSDGDDCHKKTGRFHYVTLCSHEKNSEDTVGGRTSRAACYNKPAKAPPSIWIDVPVM